MVVRVIITPLSLTPACDQRRLMLIEQPKRVHLRCAMSFQFRRMSSLAIIAMLLVACAGSSASVAPTPIPEQEPTPSTNSGQSVAPATGIPTQGGAPVAATAVPPPTSGIPIEGGLPATAIPAT